jgi:hypothetical protein
MKKYTVILPIHKISGNEEYIKKAVESAQHPDVDLMIVLPENLQLDLVGLGIKAAYAVVVNRDAADFCSQVNVGIDKVQTEWFSILELDDQYSGIWFDNVNKYMTHFTDVDAFLPFVAEVDTEGKFLSFTNESLWAMGFSNLQGYLDNDILQEYQNYQINGAVYRTEKVRQLGKFKTNITLSFGYEFLLRLTHNNAKVYAIPKIGYKHTNMRPDSLFWSYKNVDKLTGEQTKFWMETAKKEYYFTEQREITLP